MILNQKTHRLNEEIRARKVRLIGPNGEQLGVLTTQDALIQAQNFGLDLVEVAAQAKPPVCRILDYGKMKYDASKKQKKSSQKVVKKTIKLKHNIEQFDLQRKINDAQKFIDKGFQVSVQMTVRGRAKNFLQKAFLVIETFKESVENAQCSVPKDKLGKDINGRDGQFRLELSPAKTYLKA